MIRSREAITPFYKLVKPRADVKDGVPDKSVYAASLGDLLRQGKDGKRYRDKREFEKLTYETKGLLEALDNIRIRLHDGRGNGFRQIETSFGGGKTHSMIAMYHKCNDWDTIPVVIDGIDLDPSTETIWGEMQRQLDGNITDMNEKIAPGKDTIVRMLKRKKKPVLILIDEIAHYLDGSKAVGTIERKKASEVNVNASNMAAQTVNFLQKLFKIATKEMSNICVVISLPGKDQVLEKSYYEHIQQLAGREKQLITVATESDIPHIIRRRLFETDEAVMVDRSADIVKSYVDECRSGRSLSGSDVDAYAERFSNTFPFTPDVIDVLYGRWGSYPTFQRTRGALRLLSDVVHSLLTSNRPYITLSDIDLSVDTIRKELLSHLSDNVESMISSDITSSHSGATRAEEVGMRAARAIFMYSFPRECKGATMTDIKRAAFTSEINHSMVGDALGTLQRHLFFLELTDDNMFRFTLNENINKIIDRATKSVSDTAADELEQKMLLDSVGSKFYKIHVWPGANQKIDDIDRLQLIVLKDGDIEFCKKLVTEVSPKNGRVNQNALVFVLPTDGGMLSDSIRKRLAVKSIRQRMAADLQKTPAHKRVVDDMHKRAEGGIIRGLREKYSTIWLPDKDNTVKQFQTGPVQPSDDNVPLGDIVWSKLLLKQQVAEVLHSSVLDGYKGNPDDMFKQMMRTCGERRPESLEVIVKALSQESGVGDTPPNVGEKGAGDMQKTLGDDGETQTGSGGTQPLTPDNAPLSIGRPVAKPPVSGLHCTDTMDRKTMSEWCGSISNTANVLQTTTMRLVVEQKTESTFGVHLDMTGTIPRETADSIRDSLSKIGEYSEEEDW